nr:reverse transcriptase domain-containing protein [Tanacetum cinerariifolium]
MDEEPMWVADRVASLSPGSTITIPETANKFSIKRNHLTLIKGNQFDAGGIFLYKTPNQAYQLLEDKVLLKLNWAKNQKPKPSLKKTIAFADEGSSNFDTNKIMARVDAMTIKMESQYKEIQSHAKYNHCGEEYSKVPLILGRPFLHTTDVLIRVKQKQLNLGVGTKRMIFSINSAMKHSYSNDDTCFSIDVIVEILEEDFDAFLDEGSEILYSIKGTYLEDKIFAKFNEFIAMNIEENSESE